MRSQAARESAGLSQTALAQRLGISQSHLSAMELNPASVNLTQLLSLCAARAWNGACSAPGAKPSSRWPCWASTSTTSSRTSRRRHFNSTAARCFRRPDAEDLIEEVLARTPAAIDEVASKLPVGFPEHIAASIFKGLQWSADKLACMPKA